MCEVIYYILCGVIYETSSIIVSIQMREEHREVKWCRRGSLLQSKQSDYHR